MDLAEVTNLSKRPFHAWRRLLAALTICCAGVGGIPSSPAVAQVPTANLVCVFSGQFNFSPPLNFSTSSVSTIFLLSTCVSPNGRYPQLKSGILFGNNAGTATGCSPLPFKIVGDGFTGFWNDGSQSTFSLAINTNPLSGAFGLDAYLTAGTMAGAQATGAPVLVAQNGLCLFGGVRSLTLAGLVVVTQ